LQAFFGVFDGHGGANAAEFAAKNMGRYIMNQSKKISQEEIVEAVRDGYLTTDAEFLKKHSGGGTCCVTALIQEGNLVVSNAGDCRAVMSRGGVAEGLTSDHRPSREDEKERIETLVSSVIMVYNFVSKPTFDLRNRETLYLIKALQQPFCRVAMWIVTRVFGEYRGLLLYREELETGISNNGLRQNQRREC
jgi:serine/threonine protein phosphatase PrpC